MLFNTFEFLVFFVLFFVLYWKLFNLNLKIQNIFLLLTSYFFYYLSDKDFLVLLVSFSALFYFLGIKIQNAKTEKLKRVFLVFGLFCGVGTLIIFKYANFFIDSFMFFCEKLHIQANIFTLKIILPLGLSYYIFRALGYLIDIEKGKIEACSNFINFSNYLSFFPSILSGPISSAKSFIPQLEQKREYNYQYIKSGLLMFTWGLFKKVVIADNCASLVEPIFMNYSNLSASVLVMGAFLFAIQLYADFSGYSEMAMGIAKLLGFDLPKNFATPYFSQSISEFWQKWHISLTYWLSEYLYTPLSLTFRDFGKTGAIFAILINFTVVGMWHGSTWNCILFGFIHGCYFIPIILFNLNRKKKSNVKFSFSTKVLELIKMIGVFSIIMFTFIIFRTNSIAEALDYYSKLFSLSIIHLPRKQILNSTFLFICVMLLVEWVQRNKNYTMNLDFIRYTLLRWSIYYILIFCILIYCAQAENEFVYAGF